MPTYSHVTVSGFHLRAGDEEPNVDEKFILTDTVQKNLFVVEQFQVESMLSLFRNRVLFLCRKKY